MLNVASAKVRIIFRMAKISDEKLRNSTIIRYNNVHDEYNNVVEELGKYATLVPKSYIYEKVSERTGLSCKTVARALSHSIKKESFI